MAAKPAPIPTPPPVARVPLDAEEADLVIRALAELEDAAQIRPLIITPEQASRLRRLHARLVRVKATLTHPPATRRA